MEDVLIVPTGIANIASVRGAFARLGVSTRLCDDAATLAAAPRIVLPGVGAFGSGMDRLAELGLVDALRRRVRERRPTLAICLGMHLLFERSEESPETEGLGVLPGVVTRFPRTVRVPQLGWNRVVPTNDCALESGTAYFANSFRVSRIPTGWDGATTDHGGEFASALVSGGVLACQFHPEISGAYGARLLARWLETHTESAS